MGILIGIAIGVIPLPDNLFGSDAGKPSDGSESETEEPSSSENGSPKSLAELHQKLSSTKNTRQKVGRNLENAEKLQKNFEERHQRLQETLEQKEDEKLNADEYKLKVDEFVREDEQFVMSGDDVKTRLRSLERQLEQVQQIQEKLQDKYDNILVKEQSLQDKINMLQLQQSFDSE